MRFLSWSKKGVRWVIVTLMVLLITWVFHPPLAKWAIGKYGSEALGRTVSVSHFRFNPFNASARLGGLRIAEAAGDSAFLEIATLYANVDLMRTLSGHFELESLIVQGLDVRIVQDGGRFNFSDIVDRFSANGVPEEAREDEGPTKFTLLDMHLEQARISYQSHLLEWPVRVDELNVTCPRVVWNEPQIALDLDLRMKNSATIEADIALNKDDQRYAMHVQADKGRLRMFEPYVSPFMQHGGIGGTMRLDLFLSGSGQDPMAIAMKGKLQVDSMRFRDPEQVELARFERFELVVDTIDVKHELYRVQRATI
ncbi:MAG: DUF748 domain-containing protein, partial [Flavobacteriales bacterium]|nr:DUF748 domain-containing protein [Flavobacteriales bacterium]